MSYRALTFVFAVVNSVVGFGLKLQCQLQDSFLVPGFIRTCYSDVSALYGARDFVNGIIPYFEVQSDGQFLEYPVLIGMQMFVASELTAIIQPGSWQTFALVTWLFNLLCVLVSVYFLDKLNARAARWFSFSPALLLVLGINWDALAIMFMMIAIYCFDRQRYLYMGIALGLGMSSKLFPILMLPVAIVYLLQDKNLKGIVQSVVGALSSWLLVNSIFIVFAFDGWIRFFEFSRERGVDFGSLYLALIILTDVSVSTSVANTIGLLAVVVTFIAIWFLRRRIDFVIAFALLLSVFVLSNKVYSPQFWMWLAPLFALVIQDKWNWIQWNVAQVFYFFAVWAFIASYSEQEFSIPGETYSLSILLHVLSTVLAMTVVLTHAKQNQPQLEHDRIHL